VEYYLHFSDLLQDAEIKLAIKVKKERIKVKLSPSQAVEA
jgi:hypothetical protein